MGVWLGLVRVAVVVAAVLVLCVASPMPLEEEEDDYGFYEDDYEYSDEYDGDQVSLLS